MSLLSCDLMVLVTYLSLADNACTQPCWCKGLVMRERPALRICSWLHTGSQLQGQHQRHCQRTFSSFASLRIFWALVRWPRASCFFLHAHCNCQRQTMQKASRASSVLPPSSDPGKAALHITPSPRQVLASKQHWKVHTDVRWQVSDTEHHCW